MPRNEAGETVAQTWCGAEHKGWVGMGGAEKKAKNDGDVSCLGEMVELLMELRPPGQNWFGLKKELLFVS